MVATDHVNSRIQSYMRHDRAHDDFRIDSRHSWQSTSNIPAALRACVVRWSFLSRSSTKMTTSSLLCLRRSILASITCPGHCLKFMHPWYVLIQAETLRKHWGPFLSEWSKSTPSLRRCKSELPDDPIIQEVFPPGPILSAVDGTTPDIRVSGLRGWYFLCGLSCGNLHASEEQVRSILELAGSICIVISLTQKSMLYMYYTSVSNWMSLPCGFTVLPHKEVLG